MPTTTNGNLFVIGAGIFNDFNDIVNGFGLNDEGGLLFRFDLLPQGFRGICSPERKRVT